MNQPNNSYLIEEKIGFDKIRAMVKKECSNALAQRMADQMAFCNDYDRITLQLRQTDELREILLMENAFPSQDFTDLSELLPTFNVLGTVIELPALFDLKTSLRTIGECLRFFAAHTDDEKYPTLRARAAEIFFDDDVLSLCNRIVDDRGEMYDTASDALRDIRRQINLKHNEIDRRISQTLAHAKHEGWAPENAEVTFRNGRMVIPMLDTHRRKIKGLIHDESATRQTAYLEPAEVVELNNDLRELEFAEQHEIYKILLNFTDTIRPKIPTLMEAYRFLAEIDFIRAKARTAIALNAFVPTVINKPQASWFGARHPLLQISLQQQHKEIVPFNLDMDDNTRMIIISGPNSGGKAVCLKAIALLQYLLQSGMPVTAKSTSEFGIFDRLFIDIGDQQSIENDLSTYSSHLYNMKHLLAIADNRTMFFIDELGSGTDPAIGGAIAEAVLENLYSKGAWGVVTTHYANLKLLADRLPKISNAAMLFDTDKIQPLFQLSVKHPGSSFAFEIAHNIGLPDEVLRSAEEKIGTGMLNFEQQLQQIEVEKLELKKKQEEFSVADDFLNEVIEKYTKLNENLETQKHKILSDARHEAKQIIREANKAVEQTIADIKKANAEREETKRLREELAKDAETLDAQQQKADTARRQSAKKVKKVPAQPSVPIDNSPIQVGDIVSIDGQETYCQVVELKGNKAVVESGSIRMTIKTDILHKTAKQKIPTKPQRNSESRFQSIYDDLNRKRAAFSPTLDLRGKRVAEALDMIEKHIDEAKLLSERELRLLHGTGYGILKTAIREYLRTNRDVRSFRSERLELGGEGITVVELR